METKELFAELKSKLILDLQENEIVCPTCSGLRMNLVENETGTMFIDQCRDCHFGKLFVCEYCGKHNKSDCNCKEFYSYKDNLDRLKELELMNKATVIKFSDYKGMLSDGYEHMIDVDDFASNYLDNFDPEESEKLTWAYEGEILFNLNIYEILSDKSEDGYDDMYCSLNTECTLLGEVQNLLDEWNDRNVSALTVYNQSDDILIDLSKLYEEGMANLKK